jgi:hypothetical protein
MFLWQSDRGQEPNYIMLDGVHDFLISEIGRLEKRLDSSKNVLKRTLIYNSRISACNGILFYAGTKDPKDLYSQTDGSEDWQLLRYYTEEVFPNTEEKCKKSWAKFSKGVKSIFVAISKSENVIPDSDKNMSHFLRSETDKMIYNKGDYFKTVETGAHAPSSFGLGLIRNIFSNHFASEMDAEDDYNLVLATPNYKVMRMAFNMADANVSKAFRK